MHLDEELIRGAPLFSRLSEGDLRSLVSRGRVRTYSKGSIIFREGDPGDAFYVILDGSVRIAAVSADGDQLTLALIGPWESFGDLALLDGQPRSAGAIAANTTKAYVMTPLLTRLADDDLRALVKSGRAISFRKGEIIFRQDGPGDAFYVVVEGSVQITLASADGREIALAILGPGECFGDLALLDGRPRSAGAVAASAAQTFVITREDFFRWLNERPAAARSLLETLSLRLRQKDESLSDFSLLDLSHRLAKRLADLAAIDPKGKARRTGEIGVAVTQSEIATLLGVSRQSVNKELKKFESRGWIALSRGAVSVTDGPALRRYWQGGV